MSYGNQPRTRASAATSEISVGVNPGATQCVGTIAQRSGNRTRASGSDNSWAKPCAAVRGSPSRYSERGHPDFIGEGAISGKTRMVAFAFVAAA